MGHVPCRSWAQIDDMEAGIEPGHRGDPRPQPGDPRSVEWIFAHAKPRAGWERHTIPLGLFDPVPPPAPRPALLLANLLGGEVLELQRVVVPGRACPDFRVTTTLGRDLGHLTGNAAGIIEASRCEGVNIEVSVFAAVPSFPPEVALQLQLAAVVWCPAADWIETPVVFSRRPKR